MGYVALSRVKSLAGLSLIGFNDISLLVNQEALYIDGRLRENSRKNQNEFLDLSAFDVSEKKKDFENKWKGRVKENKKSTFEKTKDMLEMGLSANHIAVSRKLGLGTILTHIEKLKEKHPDLDIKHIRDTVPISRFKKIASAFAKAGTSEGGKRPLSPVKDILGSGFSFEELRVVRLFL
jgi:hypothetical protein